MLLEDDVLVEDDVPVEGDVLVEDDVLVGDGVLFEDDGTLFEDDGTLVEDDGTLEDCENDSPNCSISVTKRGRLLPVTRRYRPNKLIMKHLSSAKSNKDCLGHFLLCTICAFFIRCHETIEKETKNFAKKMTF